MAVLALAQYRANLEESMDRYDHLDDALKEFAGTAAEAGGEQIADLARLLSR